MTDSSGGLGDNSMAAGQLSAYVSRVERLEKEIDGFNENKREVYAEAKACGLCKKTLRKVIARRRKGNDQVEEEDALLELYERILASMHAADAGAVEDPLG